MLKLAPRSAMAPWLCPVEQAHYQGYGNKGLPASMDIYALGATIFMMLTGHRPPGASIILNEPFPVEELKKSWYS